MTLFCIYIPTFILQFATAGGHIFLIVFLCFFFFCNVFIHSGDFASYCAIKFRALCLHAFVSVFLSFLYLTKWGKCPQISLFKYLVILCDRSALNSADDSNDSNKRTRVANDHVAIITACLMAMGSSICTHQMLNHHWASLEVLQGGPCCAFCCCHTFYFISL